jgi:hypothetical protein
MNLTPASSAITATLTPAAIVSKEKAMADNQNSNPNGSEDQTRPAGDWDKQYVAPPDADMGAQDTTTQGRAAGSASSHEYGGSATDSRVSDSRSATSRQSDSGSEAGLMGSAYDTERQIQAGTPGSGDDRDSIIGDRADSAGRHDNPYDTVHPTDENETPETMGGLDSNSDEGDALAG